VPILGNILTVAASVIACGPGFSACAVAISAITSAATTGLASGDLGQALKAGLISAATAIAMFEVGQLTGHGQLDFLSQEHVLNIAGHAAVGCGSAVASGGDCGSGALSGAVGSLTSHLPFAQNLTREGKLIFVSVSGGLASVAGGGKFGNGAVTAAFGYLFNELGSNIERGYGTRKECIIAGGGCLFTVADNPNANGSAPWYEIESFSGAGNYQKVASLLGQSMSVDPKLIMAIMRMETTHGYYDFPLDLLGINKSILPININVSYWGGAFSTRDQLSRPYLNILFGTKMLSAIQANMPGASISQIATVYNNANATIVSNYGARVSNIYATQPWK
jgi:hypothetical protein